MLVEEMRTAGETAKAIGVIHPAEGRAEMIAVRHGGRRVGGAGVHHGNALFHHFRRIEEIGNGDGCRLCVVDAGERAAAAGNEGTEDIFFGIADGNLADLVAAEHEGHCARRVRRHGFEPDMQRRAERDVGLQDLQGFRGDCIRHVRFSFLQHAAAFRSKSRGTPFSNPCLRPSAEVPDVKKNI